MFEQTAQLQEEMFSVPVFGRAYRQLLVRYNQGLEVSGSVLAELTQEEMSHIAWVVQRHTGPVNETALLDCMQIIKAEFQARQVSSDADLLALQKKMQERKGTSL